MPSFFQSGQVIQFQHTDPLYHVHNQILCYAYLKPHCNLQLDCFDEKEKLKNETTEPFYMRGQNPTK